MTIVSRFAPSPTGRLHLGHAYSATRAHDLARAAGGRFLLRIEDIDAGRCREGFVAGIVEDLAWLGLHNDGPVVRQSERLEHYAVALTRLRDAGLIYQCFCTRAEIAASATAPHGSDGALYPGTCRTLNTEVQESRRDEAHCWRLDMAAALAAVPGDLAWRDAAAGTVRCDPAPEGDVVLARKDVATSYHLAVTVDDAAQRVTDVVRGQDLFAATHVHRLLQALLGLPTPRYHHHALIADGGGRRLAKRHGSESLADLRAGGARPETILAMLRAGPPAIGFAPANA